MTPIKWISMVVGTILAGAAMSTMAVEDRLQACRAMEDSLARLQCYDEIPVASGQETNTEVPQLIASFKGTGTKTTRPFVTTTPFIVRAKGGMGMSVMVQRPGEGPLAIAGMISIQGGDAEETYIDQPGRYTLDVMAFSPWTVEVYGDE
jgi:hypothetical protein